MKKKFLLLLGIISIVMLSGCTMNNTPTKKTEEFLNKYRSLSEDVTKQMDEVIATDDFMSNDQMNLYKDILRKQYQDLLYTIKNEEIDGDVATVTTEIEVYDFYKVSRDASKYYEEHDDEFNDENNSINTSKYIDYRLDMMKNTTDRVKYTIDFTLSKKDSIWVMDDIDDITREKIHGLYAY